MSRKTNGLSTSNHANGQVFTLKVGNIIGVPSVFTTDKRKIISRDASNYGEMVETPSTTRIQLQVIEEHGFVRLDSATMEQVGIATNKELKREDIALLEDATVYYYVSDRKEGEKFYFAPEAIIPRIAPRTGEFTSIFKIVPSGEFKSEFKVLPDRQRVIAQSDDDVKTLEEHAAEIKAEHGEIPLETIPPVLTAAQQKAADKAAVKAEQSE